MEIMPVIRLNLANTKSAQDDEVVVAAEEDVDEVRMALETRIPHRIKSNPLLAKVIDPILNPAKILPTTQRLQQATASMAT